MMCALRQKTSTVKAAIHVSSCYRHYKCALMSANVRLLLSDTLLHRPLKYHARMLQSQRRPAQSDLTPKALQPKVVPFQV